MPILGLGLSFVLFHSRGSQSIDPQSYKMVQNLGDQENRSSLQC